MVYKYLLIALVLAPQMSLAQTCKSLFVGGGITRTAKQSKQAMVVSAPTAIAPALKTFNPETDILTVFNEIDLNSKQIHGVNTEILQGKGEYNDRAVRNPALTKIEILLRYFFEEKEQKLIPAAELKKAIKDGRLEQRPKIEETPQSTALVKSAQEVVAEETSKHLAKGRTVEANFNPLFNREEVVVTYSLEADGPNRYFKFKPEGLEKSVFARVLNISGGLSNRELERHYEEYGNQNPNSVSSIYALVEWISTDGTRKVQTLSIKEFKTVETSLDISREAVNEFRPGVTTRNFEALKILRPLETRRHIDAGGPLYSLRDDVFDNMATIGAEGSGSKNVYDYFGAMEAAEVIKKFKNRETLLAWAIDENGTLIVSWAYNGKEKDFTNLKVPIARLAKGRRIFAAGLIETDPNQIPTAFIRDIQYEYSSGISKEDFLEKIEAVFDLYYDGRIQVSTKRPQEYNYVYSASVEAPKKAKVNYEDTVETSSKSSSGKKTSNNIESWFEIVGTELTLKTKPLSFNEWESKHGANKTQWALYMLGFRSTEEAKAENTMKARWRKLNSKFHPDRSKADPQIAQMINEAYDILNK